MFIHNYPRSGTFGPFHSQLFSPTHIYLPNYSQLSHSLTLKLTPTESYSHSTEFIQSCLVSASPTLSFLLGSFTVTQSPHSSSIPLPHKSHPLTLTEPHSCPMPLTSHTPHIHTPRHTHSHKLPGITSPTHTWSHSVLLTLKECHSIPFPLTAPTFTQRHCSPLPSLTLAQLLHSYTLSSSHI